jgi:hypothetical protein
MNWHPDQPDVRAPFVSVEVARTRYTIWFREGQPVWVARFHSDPERGWPVAALAADSEWAEAARAAQRFICSFRLPAVAS